MPLWSINENQVILDWFLVFYLYEILNVFDIQVKYCLLSIY